MAKGAYIGVETKVYPFDPVFENNSWSDIVLACQLNQVPITWEVGSQKTMTINSTNYVIDIIGKHHDDYADGSGKAPLTFQLHDCYGTNYQMHNTSTNSVGWTNCAMRNTHLPAVLALMPSEVQAGIKEVNKLTSAGSRSTTINTTADKLFLLSEIEVCGKTTWSASGEGSQYEYYASGNSAIKAKAGANENWWERSPKVSGSTQFCAIARDGNASDGGDANATYYTLSFAFCFGGTSELANAPEPEIKGVARKIKKGYIGIDGKARKIKKAYIGIGGVARPCWSGGELVYYGKVGDLGQGRRYVGAANAGGYLVFAAGYKGNGGSQYVDGINASLTVTTNQYGATSQYYDAAASAGNVYAMFAGGTTGSSRYSYKNTVQAFNGSLTKSWTPDTMSRQAMLLAGASVGSFAVFAGGNTFEANAEPDNFADAYNSSLTKTALTGLTMSCCELMGASSEKFAMFAGGLDSNNKTPANVTTYDKSLTRKTTTLGTGRARARGTEIGNHILVAGGFVSGSGSSTVVEAFDASLTRTVVASLSSAQSAGPTGKTTIKGFAVFMGSKNHADVYDESLTRTATISVGAYHQEGGAGVVGDYLAIGGGYDNTGGYTNGCSTRIDAFTVA